MDNSLKYKIIIIVIMGLAVSFAAGRYSVNSPNSVTHNTTKTDDTTKVDKDTNTTVTKVEVKKPDGTDVITTTTKSDTIDKTIINDSTISQVDKTITSQSKPKWNVSALAGIDLTSVSSGIVYGASVTNQILGPVNVGAFGLTNGTVGLSLGISF